MRRDIQPASNGVDRGVLPGLEPVSMAEIMGRLPEVEDFIAILNWGIECRNAIGNDTEIERYVEWQVEGWWRRP